MPWPSTTSTALGCSTGPPITPMSLVEVRSSAWPSKTSVEVMQLLKQLNAEEHITQIIVTHDPTVANQTNRIIRIKDGVIMEGE